jgi:midasin
MRDKTLRKICGDDNIVTLIYNDCVLSAPQLIGSSTDEELADAVACSDPGVEISDQQKNKATSRSMQSESFCGATMSSPFGNSTVFVSGYVLPCSQTVPSTSTAPATSSLSPASSVLGKETLSTVPLLMHAEIVETPTTTKNLQRLAQAVLLGSPTIVQGAVGCGKSFLIRKLASSLGHDSTMIEVHLDDQTDSRSLIGAYVCSDVPGEFNWQPGLIFEAATLGRWLVIEDIDKVPSLILP